MFVVFCVVAPLSHSKSHRRVVVVRSDPSICFVFDTLTKKGVLLGGGTVSRGRSRDEKGGIRGVVRVLGAFHVAGGLRARRNPRQRRLQVRSNLPRCCLPFANPCWSVSAWSTCVQPAKMFIRLLPVLFLTPKFRCLLLRLFRVIPVCDSSTLRLRSAHS